MSVILPGPFTLAFMVGWPIIITIGIGFFIGVSHAPALPMLLPASIVGIFGEWEWWKFITRREVTS